MQLRPEHLRIQVVAPGAVVATFELRNAQRIARRTFVFRHDPAGWRIVHLQASNVPWPDSPAPSRGGA
jgi:hypothetical protein